MRSCTPLPREETLAQAVQPGQTATEGTKEERPEDQPVQHGEELLLGEFHLVPSVRRRSCRRISLAGCPWAEAGSCQGAATTIVPVWPG